MPLNRKDHKEIEGRDIKNPPFANFFVSVLRHASRVPPIKKYLGETVGGLNGRIFKHWENSEFESATEVAIFGLEKYRNKKSKILPFMAHHHWWSLMKNGVYSAEQSEQPSSMDKLIEIGVSGIKPLEGYDVAYSYLAFSRRMYELKNAKLAKQYALTASEADSTWAEPDYLLGWYAVVFGEGEEESHLFRALEKDSSIFFRIASDPFFKERPSLVRKLKLKYSSVHETSAP